jgi:hypothetical protein
VIGGGLDEIVGRVGADGGGIGVELHLVLDEQAVILMDLGIGPYAVIGGDLVVGGVEVGLSADSGAKGDVVGSLEIVGFVIFLA